VRITPKAQVTAEQQATAVLGKQFISDVELEERTGIPQKTWQNWRVLGRGPVSENSVLSSDTTFAPLNPGSSPCLAAAMVFARQQSRARKHRPHKVKPSQPGSQRGLAKESNGAYNIPPGHATRKMALSERGTRNSDSARLRPAAG
jgi:hypothetical protein